MKKLFFLGGLLCLALSNNILAQGNEVDAFLLSETEINGTARSLAMGNAFGALGGNISVISANPAGLAIYRSSDAALSFDFSQMNTQSDWNGQLSNFNKNAFGVNNFGTTLYFPTGDGSILNWNFGVSFNRLKNFKRNFRMEAGGQRASLADYVAAYTSNVPYNNGLGIPQDDLTAQFDNNGNYSYDPYYNPALSGHWLSVLGYEAGLFGLKTGVDGVYHSAFGKQTGNNNWDSFTPQSALLTIKEDGYIDEYNFGIAANISNLVFIGASLSVNELFYRMHSQYEESFAPSGSDNKNDHLYLNNNLTTEGEGFSFNIGAIVNIEKVRLGVAYNTPKYYSLTDYFNAQAGSYIGSDPNQPLMENYTPADNYSEYRFRSPGKWIFSGALILGNTALLSADYELQDYKQMHFADLDGDDRGFITNDFIKEDYSWQHTAKFGAEVKPSLQFAVRAGYMWQSSPMNAQLYNNSVEVLPAGTIPHFTTRTQPTQYFTAGLGYRFNPNVYLDIAAVYRTHKSYAYAFSNIYYEDTDYQISPVQAKPASLNSNSTRLVLTLGYKF
jgi:hypothetical protein